MSGSKKNIGRQLSTVSGNHFEHRSTMETALTKWSKPPTTAPITPAKSSETAKETKTIPALSKPPKALCNAAVKSSRTAKETKTTPPKSSKPLKEAPTTPPKSLGTAKETKTIPALSKPPKALSNTAVKSPGTAKEIPSVLSKPPKTAPKTAPKTPEKFSRAAKDMKTSPPNWSKPPKVTINTLEKSSETAAASVIPESGPVLGDRCIAARRQLEKQVKMSKNLQDEKKISTERANTFMKHLLKELKQSGSFKYTEFRMSGSSATNTKIDHPDEFDYDVIIDLKEEINLNLSQEKVFYDLQNCPRSLEFTSEVIPCKHGKTIPDGYIGIYTKGRGETIKPIIPRKIQEDIYQCIKHLIGNKTLPKGLKATPYREASGPAVTVALGDGKKTIDIDISASIKLNRPEYFKQGGWPRHETKKVLETSLIHDIEQAGIHAVPKDNLFWLQSTSLAEKCLLKSIDARSKQKCYGCRKDTHRLLKGDFENWKREKRYTFPGISTMLFKHHLFWCNEVFPDDCWKKSELHQCYIDILHELNIALKNRIIKNYFNDKQNLLDKKDELVLDKLAVAVKEREHELRLACGLAN